MASKRRVYTGETALCGECQQRVRVYAQGGKHWLEPHKRMSFRLEAPGRGRRTYEPGLAPVRCRYSDSETP